MIKLKDILNEIENRPNYRISKEDEGRALTFIRKQLIPRCVNSWNRHYPNDIDERSVRLGMIKKIHKIWPEDTLHDYINYEYHFPDKPGRKNYPNGISFTFKIWKDKREQLMASYEHPLINIVSYYVDDPDPFTEVIGDDVPDKYSISKMEEQFALNAIKDIWGRRYGTKEINNTIKKIKDVKRGNGLSDIIDYEAIIRGKPMRFGIRKDDGSVFVARMLPVTPGDHWIAVSGPEKIKEGIDEIKSSGKSKTRKLIKEEDSDVYLTKMEEQYSYNYMNRVIVPKALEDTYYKHIKKVPNMYPERKYPKLTPQDIIKNIKKVRTDFDRVEYEAVITDRISFDFLIVKEYHMDKTKNGKETWNVYIICGVQGPLDTKRIWYDIEYK